MAYLNVAFCALTIICQIVSAIVIIPAFQLFTFFVLASGGFATVAVLPLLSFNRYIALFHNQSYPKLFTKPKILFYCFAPVIIMSCTIAMLVAGQTLSQTLIGMLYASEALLSTQVFLSFTFTLYFNIRIYKKLKAHQTTVLRRLKRQDRSVQRNRELLRVSIIQAIAPLLLQSPGILCYILSLFGYLSITSWYTTIAFLVFDSNPTVDAVITLYAVKPYRKAFLAWLNGLKELKCTLGSAESDAWTTGAGAATMRKGLEISEYRTRRPSGPARSNKVNPLRNDSLIITKTL